jgi:hypothetical protein
LTEDNVKQRLARGRKILQEQVLSFVEGALARSTPGRVFTLSVLAALPELATPAKAAAVGVAAVHGGMLAKSTSIATLLASFSGVASAILVLRANLDQARTPRERRAVVKVTLFAIGTPLVLIATLYLLRSAAFRWWEHRAIFAAVCQVLAITAFIAWPVVLLRTMKRMRTLRSAERRAHPELFRHPADQVGSAAGEYRSRWSLCGVPLVRVRFATPDEGERPVLAWFAGGDRAYGLVAAWGGCAIAPLSAGAISIGLFAVGPFSVGLISIGTISLGVYVMGCAAFGVKAFAWLSALGWDTAQAGGFGIARIAAEAPVAFARHANDPIAREFLANPAAERYQMYAMSLIAVLSLVPIAFYAQAVRRRLGGKARSVDSKPARP